MRYIWQRTVVTLSAAFMAIGWWWEGPASWLNFASVFVMMLLILIVWGFLGEPVNPQSQPPFTATEQSGDRTAVLIDNLKELNCAGLDVGKVVPCFIDCAAAAIHSETGFTPETCLRMTSEAAAKMADNAAFTGLLGIVWKIQKLERHLQ